MKNRIAQIFERMGITIEKYRPWTWLIIILGCVIVNLWAPNTSSNWPILPLIISLIALFFALHGEKIFNSELFHADYFIFATAGMLFICLYGFIFCLIMGLVAFVIGI